jgi:hypothetical protein
VNRKKFLLGRPVLIASHASPAYRNRVGKVVEVQASRAIVKLTTNDPSKPIHIAVHFKGLRLIQKKTPPPRRSFLSVIIPRALRAAFATPPHEPT